MSPNGVSSPIVVVFTLVVVVVAVLVAVWHGPHGGHGCR